MFSLYMSWRQIFLLIMIFVPISLSICAATVLWGFNRIGSSYEVLHESALYQADSMAVFANLNRIEKILMNPAQPPSASIAEGLEMLGEQSDRIALSSQLFGNATLSGIAGNIDQSIGDYISARIAWMEKMELAGYSRDQGLKAVTEKTQAQLVESTMGTQDEAMQRIGSALARYYDDPTERTAAAVNNALDLFGEQVEMFGWGDTAIGESFEQLRDVFSQLNQALMSAGLLSQQVTEIYDHLEGFDEQQRHVIDSELQATTLRQAEEARASARNTTLIAFFLVITLLLIVLAIVSRTLGTQLQRFISLFSRVAGGDLTGGVPSSRNYRSEFTKLAESANQMIHGIAQIIIQAKEGTDRLSSVKQELDSTMDRLSQSNDTVSNGIQEVATSSQEISVTVNDIASRTNAVGLSARRVNEQAERGSVVVKDSADALTELSGLIREAHQLMRSLKDSSNQVNGIVTVINGIAGQTNLLALNAAIEAARAGEAGRGFAVVADEVRTLAGQTVSATSDIAGIVANLESRTSDIEHLFENGLGLAEKGEATSSHIAETMRSIESSLEALSGEMDQVVVAVEEVSATTDDMAMRLEGAREQTEGITAVISELGAQDRILGRVALELDDATSKFLLTK